MTDPAVAQGWLASQVRLIQTTNNTAWSNYKTQFGEWVSLGQQGTPPGPPVLKSLNQALALALFDIFSDAFNTALGTANPVLDFSAAVTFFTPAPIAPPLPVIPPPPSDPVGPDQGTQDLQGREMYYNVSGDSFVNGQRFTDARGTFVHVVIATPFGMESYWAFEPSTVSLTV